jgi:hypothetical protein
MPSVCDVRLGVELVLGIYAAIDFAAPDRIDDGGHPSQKVIRFFFPFDTLVKRHLCSLECLSERFSSPQRYLITHEDVELIDFLPLTVKREQTTNLKVPCGDVDRMREVSPIVKITANLPVRIAVVDYEDISAGSSIRK